MRIEIDLVHGAIKYEVFYDDAKKDLWRPVFLLTPCDNGKTTMRLALDYKKCTVLLPIAYGCNLDLKDYKEYVETLAEDFEPMRSIYNLTNEKLDKMVMLFRAKHDLGVSFNGSEEHAFSAIANLIKANHFNYKR